MGKKLDEAAAKDFADAKALGDAAKKGDDEAAAKIVDKLRREGRMPKQ